VIAKFPTGTKLSIFAQHERAALDERFLADLALLPRDTVLETSGILTGDPS
jgi:hypothetical protein